MSKPKNRNIEMEITKVTAKEIEAKPTGVSTDEAKLNKLEKAFLAYLRALTFKWIGIQCITLKLADDCRYTPDFWTCDAFGCVFQEDSAEAREQAAALMDAGWRFEIPRDGLEPWQWQWRSPPKRKGSLGKLHLSTNQAYRALMRSRIEPKK